MGVLDVFKIIAQSVCNPVPSLGRHMRIVNSGQGWYPGGQPSRKLKNSIRIEGRVKESTDVWAALTRLFSVADVTAVDR
jgi:hypothetical protein